MYNEVDLSKGIIQHVKPECKDVLIRDISMAKYCDDKFCEYSKRGTCIHKSFVVNACYDAIGNYMRYNDYFIEE